MKKTKANFCEEVKENVESPKAEAKVIVMQTAKPLAKQLTLEQIRAKKTHDDCEKKVNSLVLAYLGAAKDDSFGEKHYFDKYNNEWKNFVIIKNKQQRDIVVNLDSFRKRVDFMIDLANKQIQEQKEDGKI